MTGDGTSTAAVINKPTNQNEYTDSSRSAIVNDQLYIFGGKASHRRVISGDF